LHVLLRPFAVRHTGRHRARSLAAPAALNFTIGSQLMMRIFTFAGDALVTLDPEPAVGGTPDAQS